MQNPNSAAIYARQFSQAFETRTRADSTETFTCLKDDAPQWMTDAVHAAHGSMLPDDWAYGACEAIADRLADCEPESWDDEAHEACDAMVDVYNGRLLHWVASHLDRMGYCDEALEEGLCDASRGLSGILMAGQYRELEGIWQALASAIEAQADEEPCAWVAGWNMPGYMPDNVPAGFDNADEARAYLAEQMRQQEEDIAANWGETASDAVALREAADDCESGSDEYGCTVAGYHYFATRA